MNKSRMSERNAYVSLHRKINVLIEEQASLIESQQREIERLRNPAELDLDGAAGTSQLATDQLAELRAELASLQRVAWGVVHNAPCRKWRPVWVNVMAVTGLGSGAAKALCRQFGRGRGEGEP